MQIENIRVAPVTITDEALTKLREMEAETKYLRLDVVPGGCSGFSYDFYWDEEATDEDYIVDDFGEDFVLVFRESLYNILNGTVIDYVESLFGGGFTINNPNAVRSCGCGQSFRTAHDTGAPELC